MFDDLLWLKTNSNGALFVGVNKMDCNGVYWEPVDRDEAFRSLGLIADHLAETYPDITDGEIDAYLSV